MYQSSFKNKTNKSAYIKNKRQVYETKKKMMYQSYKRIKKIKQ